MAREQFQTLSEPMHYILLTLLEEQCGVDIMDMVKQLSNNRVEVGPGTLYALIDKFLDAKMIRETRIEGRRKHYIITELGKEKLIKERKRLKLMLDDGRILE